MMSNSNKMTKEEFIASIVHPRKKQLAEMILNEATPEEIAAASFDRSRVLEMQTQISRSVQGMEDLCVPKTSKHNIALEGDVPGRTIEKQVPEVAPVVETETIVPPITPETPVASPIAAPTEVVGTETTDPVVVDVAQDVPAATPEAAQTEVTTPVANTEADKIVG